MSDWLSIWQRQALDDPWWQSQLLGGTQALALWALVAARLAGLFVWGPPFAHSGLPFKLRGLLVLALSLLILPPLWARHASQPLPTSFIAWAPLALGELSVGLALGFGGLLVFSAFAMAGQLIDQQLGLSLGATFLPEAPAGGSLSGQLLQGLGLMTFLLVGGDVLVITSLLDTFQAIPPGQAALPVSTVELLNELLQQSLLLTLQISAPIVMCVGCVGIALGWLGRTVPQMDLFGVGIPVRALVGWIVLGLALSGAVDVAGGTLPDAIGRLRNLLMEPG
ncbi:MAG: flagellar biosynthetic protein FliR [Planctomycetales bacterium]